MRTISAGLLAVLLLVSACSTSTEVHEGARPSADDRTPASTTADDLLFGVETGTTVVIAAGYGTLTAVDLDRGHAQRFDELDGVPGDHAFRIVPLDDGVAYPGGGGPLAVPWSFDAAPHPLGPAWIFLPGGTPDRVWLVPTYAVAGGPPVVAREVDGRGQPTGREATVPLDAYPIGALGDQLVLQGQRDLRTWLEPSGEPLPIDAPASTLAVGDDALAVAVGGEVQILDGEGGRTPSVTRAIVADGDVASATSGAFAPDGRHLAVWSGSESDGRTAFVLVDTETGEREDVLADLEPGYGSVAWSSDGRWAFAIWRGIGPHAGTSIVAHELATGRTAERAVPGLQAGALVAVPPGRGPDLDGDLAPCPEPGGLDDNGNPLPAVSSNRPCGLAWHEVRPPREPGT